jgi:hypothetical protein
VLLGVGAVAVDQLGLVLLLLLGVEPVEQLCGVHDGPSFPLVDGPADGVGEAGETVALGEQRALVLAQDGGAVDRGVEHPRDRVEREPELAQHEHLLEAVQLGAAVVAVPVAPDVRRRQPHVVMVQGREDTPRAGHLDDRPAVRATSCAHDDDDRG